MTQKELEKLKIAERINREIEALTRIRRNVDVGQVLCVSGHNYTINLFGDNADLISEKRCKKIAEEIKNCVLREIDGRLDEKKSEFENL